MNARAFRTLLAIALLLSPSAGLAQNVAPQPQDVPGAVKNPPHSSPVSCTYFSPALPASVLSELWGLTCDATGALRVNVIAGGGSGGSAGPVSNAGTSSATAANVQGVSGGVPLPVTFSSGSVSVSNFPATQPVSGAFYQATQPVSIAATVPVSVATTLPVAVQGTVPVSGAFFQATQPVSVATTLPVAVQGTVPVSGAFYQTTQPVSIATTLPVAVAGTVPVSGTFFQTTQPVSIATTLPISGNVGALGTGGQIATDANGVQSHKVCDATTSTQCAAVDTTGGLKLSTTATTGLGASNATSLYAKISNGSSSVSLTTPSDTGARNTGLYVDSQNLAWNGTYLDLVRKEPYANGPLWVTPGGSTTAAIAAGAAGPTVLKSTPGRLVQLLVVVAGTSSETCYDSATNTGIILAITPATTTVGQILRYDVPAATGMACYGGTGSPGLTASFF